MSLQFKKCKTCGRIFQSSIGNECADCIDERERQFAKVKEFLYEKPGATMTEVVEETGVDSRLVTRFLKEGRLEMAGAAGILSCEKCGAPITSGTMCTKCKEKLSRAMESVLPKPASGQDTRERSSHGGSSKGDRLHVNVHGR